MEPLPQRIVPFHDDEIVAVQKLDGTIFILFSKLCENLGLSRWTQTRRAQSHAVLSKGLIAISVETSGGPQEVQCLRLDLLPLWLASVPASKTKAEIKEKLIRYQTEAAQALWHAFKPQIIIETSTQADNDANIAQLERLVEQSRAITRMAEEQLAQARRINEAARLVKSMQTDIADVQIRLGVLEDRLHPGTYITDAQASEVSNQVKALAELLSHSEANKNHYQGIFGELYRRFGVSSYKVIRQEQYAAVLQFLEDWRHAIADEKLGM